jgi:large subunit ribosomal protein L18
MRKTKPSIAFRRKRKDKTNYRKRMNLLKSGTPRLVIRPSLKNLNVQIIQYGAEGDKVVVSANSSQLKKHGWKGSSSNIPAAYLIGLLAGKNAKNIKEAKLDIFHANLTKACKIYAAVKGVVDSGIKVSVPKDLLPSEDRVKGKHVEDYAKSIAGSKKYNAQFSQCMKQGLKPEELTKHFDEIKSKIIG